MPFSFVYFFNESLLTLSSFIEVLMEIQTQISGKFWDATDAAMSIEVAEHIPAEYEEAFINNLVNSARHLIFLSWGVPGQGGEGHVNGQWGEDVVKKMNQRGWKRNNDNTQRLQNDAEFEWLKQNVQVFQRNKD